MEENYEEYEEVPSDYDDYDEDLTFNDFVFVGGLVIIGCAVIAFIAKVIKKTFKNVHLKFGNKIEIGVETKEEEQK